MFEELLWLHYTQLKSSLSYIKLHFCTSKGVVVHFLNKIRHTPTIHNFVITKIHYSPTQYLANATFGTSVEFQMREEMRLENLL